MSLGGLSLKQLTYRTYRAIIDNEIQTRAAGVAFYAMLALVPFIGLILFMTVQLLPDLTGRMASADGIGHKTVTQFRQTLEQVLPPEAAGEIEDQIARLQTEPPVGFLSFGLAVTLWLASSIFVAVIDATNRIYGVVDRRSWIKLRLIAIAMTILQAIILVGSLVTIVFWSQFVRWMGFDENSLWLVVGPEYFMVYVMTLFSFALTFYVAPDADQKLEWISPGSLLGAGAFLVSTLGFRVYVHNFANYNKTYGLLGGVMVLLFWFWIAALVLLVAAQINNLIEAASPLGKNAGQRTDNAEGIGFGATSPNPESVPSNA